MKNCPAAQPTIRSLLGLGYQATKRSRCMEQGDARALLAGLLGIRPVESHREDPDRVIPPGIARKYRQMLARAARGYPVAYLLGWTEFMGRRFKVTPDVLVPRPETEFLVQEALARIPSGNQRHPEHADSNVINNAMPSHGNKRFFLIADIGTGSGCIAVSLAAERPRVRVFATDTSASALAVARKNARSNKVSGRIRLLRGNLFEPLGRPPRSRTRQARRLDMLVSNPPYVRTGDMHKLPPQVKAEPKNALDGGADGLDMIRKLIAGARDILRPGGNVIIEIDSRQQKEIGKMAKTCGYENVRFIPDFSGRARIFAATVPSRVISPC